MSSRDRQSSRADSGVALGELSRFSEKLSVPDAVTHEAARIYTRSLERGLSKGRLIQEITASSLYAACREKEVPVTPDDVAAAIRQWENVGFDGINFIAQFMEIVPQQYVLDSMRLFAQEVMPQFKSSPVRQPVGVGAD